MTGVGLCVPQLGPHVNRAVLEGFCRRAEELGYTSLWVQDHFLAPVAPRSSYGARPGAPVPPQYHSVFSPTEILAAAATWTEQVTLGTSVLVAGNHWPASLASRLATIDQLSGGRLVVGLAVGWNAEEHEASGTDFHRRGRRIEDFVDALRACWGPDPVSHSGPFFTIDPAKISPKPLQTHPTLLSGMTSPAGIERTIAQYDGWNPAGRPVADVAVAVAAMNARRRPGQRPLRVFHRTFAVRPNQAEVTDDPVVRLTAEVEAATAAGFEEVIVECNFDPRLTDPDQWLAVPEKYLPLLDAVAPEAA